jgi:hypothetical protein
MSHFRDQSVQVKGTAFVVLMKQIAEAKQKGREVKLGCNGEKYGVSEMIVTKGPSGEPMLCELHCQSANFFLYQDPETGVVYVSMSNALGLYYCAQELWIGCGPDVYEGQHGAISAQPELPIWIPVKFDKPCQRFG